MVTARATRRRSLATASSCPLRASARSSSAAETSNTVEGRSARASLRRDSPSPASSPNVWPGNAVRSRDASTSLLRTALTSTAPSSTTNKVSASAPVS